MRIFRIIGVLGFVLSLGAGTYASMRYIALSDAAKVIAVLSQNNDVMTPKIHTILEGRNDKDLIVNELKNRHERILSLHNAYAEMAANGKSRAMQEILLWIAACLLFLVVMARTYEKK